MALFIVDSLFIFLHFASDFSFLSIGSVGPPLFYERSEIIVYLFWPKLKIWEVRRAGAWLLSLLYLTATINKAIFGSMIAKRKDSLSWLIFHFLRNNIYLNRPVNWKNDYSIYEVNIKKNISISWIGLNGNMRNILIFNLIHWWPRTQQLLYPAILSDYSKYAPAALRRGLQKYIHSLDPAPPVFPEIRAQALALLFWSSILHVRVPILKVWFQGVLPRDELP